MNDLDSKIAEEIDDEALFRLAEGEERGFSPEYQQSMEQLYRKARTHPKRRMKPIRRIVAIAAIIAMLTGAAAAATFWEEIQQFFVTTFGQYAVLQTGDATSPAVSPLDLAPEDWNSFWCPMGLGSEYSVISVQEVGTRRAIVFKGTAEEFKLFQWSDKRSINADNDTTSASGVYVNDKEVFATEKELEGIYYRTIVWTINGTSFELDGTCAFNELSKIAESLVLIER